MDGKNPRHVTRREFLESLAVFGASVGLVACGGGSGGADSVGAVPGVPELPPEPEAPAGLPTRVLGRTGVEVPILGYGGAALAARYGNSLSIPDRVELVRRAYDEGIRYFDTAHQFSYSESQEVLGEGLQGIRDDVFITSKVDFWNPGAAGGQLERVDRADVARQVEDILAALGTDYVDAMFIHGTPGLEQMTVEQALEVREELGKAQDRGQVRFVGFSAHHYFDKALALIESDQFDLCMLAYGYIPRGLSRRYVPATIELRDACIARADELGMGIVAMKVLGAGLLGGFEQPVRAAACRYILKDERIHNLTIGMGSPEELDANVGSLLENTQWSDADAELLEEAGARVAELDAFRNMPAA